MLKARIIIEILGSPKEHVEKSIRLVVDKIKEEKKVTLISEYISEAAEVKGFWSSFTELTIEVEYIKRLVDICFDYMPSTVEILEPESINFESNKIESMLNDLLARIHRYDMLLKNFNAENYVLKQKLEKKTN